MIYGQEMFDAVKLCIVTTYVFKGHVKIVKIYMVKFNVSILKRLKIMGFFVNTKQMHKHNAIFNKTVTKIVTILTKCFFHIWTPQASLTRVRKFRLSAKVFFQKQSLADVLQNRCP